MHRREGGGLSSSLMTARTPLVVVLAGPNGAGKSTSASSLLRGALAVEEFVNADTIALGLSAYRPDAAAVAAGRVMLDRLRQCRRWWPATDCRAVGGR
jgi:predicted ABC-type ATPase